MAAEGTPCVRGNIAPRSKYGACLCDGCVDYRKARAKAYRNDHKKREEIKAKAALYRALPDKKAVANYKNAHYLDDPEKRAAVYARMYARRHADPRRGMLAGAKRRAKAYGVPFDLVLEDIVVPKLCPVLGIPIGIGGGKTHAGSPSLDRIIPELGYVPGNVAVISHRANKIKNDATAAELRAVAEWVEIVTLPSIPENK